MERIKIKTTVEIPKNELFLLADTDFLGSSFDMWKWLTQAVHEAIIRELDKLALTDLQKVRSLERKYNLESKEA